MPTSNQQPPPQSPTPWRDRPTMRRTRAKGQEVRDRIGDGGEKSKKRKIKKKRYVDTGETWEERGKNIEKKELEVLVQ